MKTELARANSQTWDDEHAAHQVRAYDFYNKLAFERTVSSGSAARELGRDLSRSKDVTRVVIRCVFPMWCDQWLIKHTLLGRRTVKLPEELDVETYRLIYYGPDDLPMDSADFDEQPGATAIKQYFQSHRHCAYAVVLAFHIPVEGEGVVVNALDNPRFRVRKDIALGDKPSAQDIQAYLGKTQAEHMQDLVNAVVTESAVNRLRSHTASLRWGYEQPVLPVNIKRYLDGGGTKK